jgi:hypothetical protein
MPSSLRLASERGETNTNVFAMIHRRHMMPAAPDCRCAVIDIVVWLRSLDWMLCQSLLRSRNPLRQQLQCQAVSN